MLWISSGLVVFCVITKTSATVTPPITLSIDTTSSNFDELTGSPISPNSVAAQLSNDEDDPSYPKLYEKFIPILSNEAISCADDSSEGDAPLPPSERYYRTKPLPTGELSAKDFSIAIAIPDIHGDLHAFILALWLACRKVEPNPDDCFPYKSVFEKLLLEAAMRGNAPDTLISKRTDVALIIMGDVNDRGPYAKYCYKLIELLPKLFAWTVKPLLGNHELLSITNLSEEYGLVHPLDHISFGGQEQRDAAFGVGGDLWNSFTNKYLTMVRFSSQTDPKVNTLFVHAGVDLNWLLKQESWVAHDDIKSVDKFNERISIDLMLDDIRRIAHLYNYSPIGDRIFGNDDAETKLCPPTNPAINSSDSIVSNENSDQLNASNENLIDKILNMYGVSRIVVGHTPQLDRQVASICNKKILFIDIMMSRWMFGKDVANDALAQPFVFVINTNGLADQKLESITAHYCSMTDPFLEWDQRIYKSPIFVSPKKKTNKSEEPVMRDENAAKEGDGKAERESGAPIIQRQKSRKFGATLPGSK